MSSGSNGSSDHADSDDEEGHEPLGLCPYGHDNDNRDCRCPCQRCPNRGRNPNQGPPTPAAVTRRIRDEITYRIRESGYFPRESGRVDHGGLQAPHHTETVGVPTYPPLPANLRSNNRANAPPITALHADAFDPLSAVIGGFASESAIGFPSNAQDHHSLTIALGQRPCTEMVPWDEMVADWTDPCPRDRRGLGVDRLRNGNQRGQSWPCHETGCQQQDPGVKIQRYDFNQQSIDSDDENEEFADDYRDPNDEDPPGGPETHNDRRWVCEHHKRDAEGYWEHENLLEAHRVPTCNHCKTEHQGMYPLGHNSCTCANLLARWQCRRCFEKKVRIIQTHFRQRVGAHYTGEADFDMISSNLGSADPNHPDLGPGLSTYHRNREAAPGWRPVRRMLIARHPCVNPGLSRRCGGKRAGNHALVMHCRSCGGVVVKPSTTRVGRYATRSGRQVRHRRQASPLQELVFPRGTRGGRGNRMGVARAMGANGPPAPETAGTAIATTGPNASGTASADASDTSATRVTRSSSQEAGEGPL